MNGKGIMVFYFSNGLVPKAKEDSQSRYYAQIGQGKAMAPSTHTLIERYINLRWKQ